MSVSKVRKRKKMDWYSLMLDEQYDAVYCMFLRLFEEFKNKPRYSLKFKDNQADHVVEKKMMSDNRLAYCAFRRLYPTTTLNELRDKYGVL